MTVWNKDRISRLKALWLEGRTADFIARHLDAGISRSAVLGKLHRLGLARGRAGSDQPAPAAQPARTARAAATAPRPAPRPARRAAAATAAHAEPPPPAPACGTRTVRSVGRAECRWPFGDPGSPAFRLCGRPVTRGAFCAAHASCAYRPAPKDLDGLIGLA